MDDGATHQPQHTYRVIVNRAVVLDAIDAIYRADLRLNAILGYLPFGTIFDGVPFAAPISADITAHAVQIEYPVQPQDIAAPQTPAYVLRSHVCEVAP